MSATPQNGWAVFVADKPLISSVAPTRVAAIINFLVAERGILIFQTTTSDQIEQAWQDHKRDSRPYVSSATGQHSDDK